MEKVNHNLIIVLICINAFIIATKCDILEKLNLKPSNLTADPDEQRSVPEIIKSRGYKCETHYVTTSDGYILGLHRIVNPRGCQLTKCKPLIMWHGIFGSSSDFIINEPGAGLKNLNFEKDKIIKIKDIGNNIGFVMSDIGYDVWLGNGRGNVYSTNHTHLNPFGRSSRKFWDFDLTTYWEKDIKESFDYIKKVTGKEEFGFIGHSQATSSILCLIADNQKISKSLKPVILLSPMATAFFSRVVLVHLLQNDDNTRSSAKRGGQFLPYSKTTKLIASSLCKVKQLRYICENLFGFMGGFSAQQMNYTRLPVYANHIPVGISVKGWVHITQIIQKLPLAKFDHGKAKNIKIYGQPDPPSLIWPLVKNPHITVFIGDNDLYSTPETLDYMSENMPVPFATYRVPYPLWSHLDYLWGKQAGFYVNSKLVEIFSEADNLNITVNRQT